MAEILLRRGWTVAGTCRDGDRRDAIVAKNITTFSFDGSRPPPKIPARKNSATKIPATKNSASEISAAVARATHLLITIPPQPSGDVVLRQFGHRIAQCKNLRWLGYISSTGVYGDARGEWVDETSPLRATTARNLRRIAAESAWLKMGNDHGLPVMIFRCAGIYGSGRNLLVSVQQGRARRIDKPALTFSRVHVEDLAQTLQASMEKPQPGEIYNVSDDCPCPPAAAVEYACDLLRVQPPPLVPYEDADLSATARGFYDNNKRVANKKIKEELGVKLRYPDYRSGLDALRKNL